MNDLQKKKVELKEGETPLEEGEPPNYVVVVPHPLVMQTFQEDEGSGEARLKSTLSAATTTTTLPYLPPTTRKVFKDPH